MIIINRLTNQLRSNPWHCLKQPTFSGSRSISTKAFYTLKDENCPYIIHNKSNFQSSRDHNPLDFEFYPNLINQEEQVQWIESLLLILNRQYPKRRNKKSKTKSKILNQEGFEKVDQYDFQDGHFDTVIKDFREHEIRDLNSISIDSLKKLINLFPTTNHQSNLMAHILHLSETGRIDRHVDNPIASGPTILGLSLGGERVMHLFGNEEDKEPVYKILLPPGSVYLQRNSIRYSLPHAIPEIDEFQGRNVGGTQRLSLILRDVKTDHDTIN
ncbi:uncharacterized protein MELLADRAFT_116809 [Melampsora larici-populina 98AG31]|uniref:Fe2OG dioxygenase domain-containing protein n=1 Tax=Melampsora larici-populina (strain 98AG31 / pathotype 3-4-7) TaxID=747676 RepID=F4RQ29_MELLP|nr:uncharacterized protein MELLADRAFT_116809 [Melampsora larici-populina 98AG31]EGG05334.1 hypothetical protein MELLADRAFT_116809 [Melampsora larici-populina 98AG31]